MRFALCQTNPTVGDFAKNVEGILAAAHRAAAGGARVAVFSELALSGYPSRDLFQRRSFVEDAEAALSEVAAGAPRELMLLLGCFEPRDEPTGRRLHNGVAVIRDGAVTERVRKRLLPSYDVFEEDRWFEAAGPQALVEVDGIPLGIAVCEDAWNDASTPFAFRRYADNPVMDLVAAGARVLVVSSASPFGVKKRIGRPRMLAEVAKRHGLPLVYVNPVGAQDDLIFEGASALFGSDGGVRARAAFFEEDVVVADLETGGDIRPEPDSDAGAALDALVLGVRDYFRKCGFERAVLGLSGGIDSALVACIGAEALGADQVLGVGLPTRYSSEGSLTDARALAENLGIRFHTLSIDQMFQSYLDELGPHLDVIGPERPGDVTFENVQARIRGNVLMALTNRHGSLLLATGNKSEIAVGYSTLYGDTCGALAVISDLPKTVVYEVAREVNRRAGRHLIPESTMTKAPSAELRPDQTDQDTLPPYDVLDPILERYVERGESPEDIVAAGFEEETVRRVVRMVRINEHKRWQLPPGLKISPKAFGPGRRVPIAHRYRR